MGQQTPATLVLFVVLLLHATLVKSLVDIQHTSHQLNNSVDWSIEFERYIDNQVSIQFMPGNYEVENNTVITNVRNFSITGESSSVLDVTFNCTKFSGWVIANSSFIEINNVRFLNCGKRYDIQPFKNISSVTAAIFIYNVSSIRILNVNIENNCGYGIFGLDIIGRSAFENVIINGNNGLSTLCDNCTISEGMILLNLMRENENKIVQENAFINIKQCKFLNIQPVWCNRSICPIKHFNSSGIGLFLYQVKYHIEVNIKNVNITNINITTHKSSIISISYSMNSTSNVTIANSSITNTNTTYSTVEIHYESASNINITSLPKFNVVHNFFLISCRFSHNKADHVFNIKKNVSNGSLSVQLKNNVFESNIARDTLFETKAVVPLLSGYLNFSNNKANVIFSMTNYVLLDEGAEFSFINNSKNPWHKLKHRFIVKKNDQSSQECPFQFTNSTNVSIIFHANTGYYRTVYGNSFFGCTWIPSFPNREKLLPYEIYSKIIQYGGALNRSIFGWENSVCPCNNTDYFYNNCLNVKSFSVYPGESITIGFIHFYFDIAMYTNFNASKFKAIAPACGIYLKNLLNPKIDLVFNHCTTINYTIISNSTQIKMCLLLLKTATKEKTDYAIRVHLKTCPLGFVLDIKNGICECDPKFENSLKGLKCDISNHAFQRPSSSWIGNDGNDIIFTQDCLLYCLRTVSLIQLTKPDSQCLSGRSGITCGHCAEGLSAVFGTFRCKRCTNYWLFLLPAFAIAGLLLVLVLFVFNLTVVDGDIYGFILMVNGLSIHSSRVFPSTKDFSWIFVSLCNLDLGIEVCFYNGMTTYSATWLRLMFPIYVLLLVVAMGFASRYFQMIEKVTRKRVIPVMATLYLLSYSKLMQVTFRGLFSYTTIHHLYAVENKDVYWSMDSSVPLFGIEFSLLFIFCSIVFLFLIIPTNVLLISGKNVYRFKTVVTYLKPFLDAYQAPFKDNCRYLLGVEFFLRTIIYAITSLSAQNTTAIYNTILLLYIVYVCQVMPFKSRLNSIFYSLNLVYMSGYVILFTRFYPFMTKTYGIIFNLIFYLSFLQFLVVIAVHIWKYNLHHYTLFINFENFIKKYQVNYTRNSFCSSQNNATLSDASYENFQEELLALETN